MNFTEIALSDASNEAKIEAIGIVLDKKVQELEKISVETSLIPGPKGDKGEKGNDGKPGKDGVDGRPGIDGKDGKDGIDGIDGKDGISIVDAYIDFDGSLVIKLSDGKEINAGDVEVTGQSKENVIQLLKNGALSLNELLPSQVGNNGKALFTDGANTYWGTASAGSGGTGSFDYGSITDAVDINYDYGTL